MQNSHPCPNNTLRIIRKRNEKKSNYPKKKNSESLNLCGTKFVEREIV